MIEVTQGYNNEFPLTETENKFVHFYPEKSYIVVLNGNPIGFFNMSELKGIGKVNLEYCLLKGYRGQKIGDAFYKLVLEYVSKSFPHYSGITLLVDYRNEIARILRRSIKIKNMTHTVDVCVFLNTLQSFTAAYLRLSSQI